MPAPSLTYTLTNGSTADATQVQQNFQDLLNGYTDGTKDLSISALTCAGTATLNGHVNLGNSSADDLTITASLASTIPIKTTNTYNIGSATLGLAGIYFGTSDTDTVRIVAAGTMAASRTYTLPDAGAAADFIMSQGAQTKAGVLTLSNGVSFGSATLANYEETTATVTFDTGAFTGGSAKAVTAVIRKVGKMVFVELPTPSLGTTNATSASMSTSGTPLSSYAPAATVHIPIETVINGGVNNAGYATVSATGVVQVLFHTNGSTTVASGSTLVGFLRCVLAYTVA